MPPSHFSFLKKQFYRYLLLARRRSYRMPMYAVLEMLEAFLTSPLSVHMYPDFPNTTVDGLREFYVTQKFEDFKKEHPEMTDADVQKVGTRGFRKEFL